MIRLGDFGHPFYFIFQVKEEILCMLVIQRNDLKKLEEECLLLQYLKMERKSLLHLLQKKDTYHFREKIETLLKHT